MRTFWGAERGFPGGAVSSIAQTPDGYLWIGTDRGLVRFDGLNFRQFEQATPSSFPIGPVQTMLADVHGNLWILLRNTKLLRYREGKFELSRGEAENGITAMGRGTGDRVLLSSVTLGTLAYNGERFVSTTSAASSTTPGNPDDLSTRLGWSTYTIHRLANPNSALSSVAETADGKVWLGAENGDLFSIGGGHVSPALRGSETKITCLLPVGKRELWIGTSNGVMRWDGTEVIRTGVPPALQDVGILAMIRDRDSNLWVGTTRGLLRVNSNGVSSLPKSSAEAGVVGTALFEDREGNIWVGGAQGVERLRDSAFVTYTAPGLKSQSMGPLYVDADANTWFGPNEGGLRWLKEPKGGAVTEAGLEHDVVYSITGAGSDLWVGRQRGGLTHLRVVRGAFTAKTYTQADGLAQNSIYAVYQSQDGAVWSGTLSGGVSELKNGQFTTYTTANGLASNTVSSIAEGADGTMWFGTPNGLSAKSNAVWRTYTVPDGLPSADVSCLSEDSDGILWIGTADGLAYIEAGHIHVPRSVPDSLRAPIFGMVEDKGGWLWVATASHVLQVKRGSLMGGALAEVDVREYGLDDGLQGTEGVKRFRSVVADKQGRVWFSTNRGLSVVNPERATASGVPAPVHIQAVLVDGSPLELGGRLRLPAGKQRATFRYVGLSLGNAERVRYRYRLDGFDRGWSEPVTNREATYANLGAGSYQFRVTACNSDGIWNGEEAAVGFDVEPALWQTWWFRLGLVLCAGLSVLAVYRIRAYQLTRLLSVRFEERLAERTRIAQDLHDTLLQGVLSASMQLHVAVDQVPDDSPLRPGLDRVLQLMEIVIKEGRNTLRGLRSSIDSAQDLKNSFSRIPQELGQPAVDFRVVVEGEALPLRAAVRDDVYRIGREALVNAFRHSGAENIDLNLEYAATELRILVRDDGCGISPAVLDSSRDGHWGLTGMRERAEQIGGKLRVLSREGGGTEVELRLPSHIAWDSHHPMSGSVSRWSAILFGRKRNQSSRQPGRDGNR